MSMHLLIGWRHSDFPPFLQLLGLCAKHEGWSKSDLKSLVTFILASANLPAGLYAIRRQEGYYKVFASLQLEALHIGVQPILYDLPTLKITALKGPWGLANLPPTFHKLGD